MIPGFLNLTLRTRLLLPSAGLLAAVLLNACQAVPAAQLTREPGAAASATASPALPSIQTDPSLTPPIQLPPPVDPKNLKGVVLLFWHPYSGALQQEVDAFADEFNQTNVWGIEVKVKATGSSGAMFDQLQDGLENGGLPDMVATTISQIIEFHDRAGKLVNLDSYIFDPQWGLTEKEVAGYPLIFWNSAQRGGQRLAIPASRDMNVIFYNETWAKELGFFAPPGDQEAFRQQACSAAKANANDKDRSNDGTGGWIIDPDAMTQLSWMMSFGDLELPAAENQPYHFNTPGVVETYRFLRDLFDGNCAWVSRIPQPYSYFATRSALFYSGTLADIPQQVLAQAAAGSSDQWKVIPYPAGGRKPFVLSGGTSYAVMNSSPERQLASWLFLRWLILPRNQARMVSAQGSLPVNHIASEELSDYSKTYPQWEQSLKLMPFITEGPSNPSWRKVQYLVEDSAWQLFQAGVTPDQAGDIPRQLDLMAAEILKQH